VAAAIPDLTVEWTSDDGTPVRMRRARLQDREALRRLYIAQYGDRYALPEVVDDERSREVLTGENWVWLLAETQGEVVASLIFGWDPVHRLGKSFAGVVDPDRRGNKTMQRMLREGLDRLLINGETFELVYAVVRTFVPLSFHRDLTNLGFHDVGVFPNVRKVLQYETHGLKVCLGPTALLKRRRTPHLIPQLEGIYGITRERFGLEPALIDHAAVEAVRRGVDLRVELRPVAAAGSDGVTKARIEMLRRSSRDLKYGFFPLHEPNQILSDPTGKVRVFLSHTPTDGHSSILGVDPGPYDPVSVLMSVSDYCAERGGVYLELLTSAYDPRLQAAAYLAGYLPCGYFLAGARDHYTGQRKDVVVSSKTFVPLHFAGLRLTETCKPYLLEFFKVYTGRLWEELMDA
jgi:hypothetical protein